MRKLSQEEKKEIKSLRKDKDFDAIYLKYGQGIFSKNVSSKHKKEEIKKLLKDGRFLDIYNKYGEEEYNKYLSEMAKIDVKSEKGNNNLSIISYNKSNIFSYIKKTISYFITATSIATPTALAVAPDLATQSSIYENYNKVQSYMKDVEDYSKTVIEDVNKYNYTDVEIFMKLMYDMWNDIDGYKPAENEILGALGASLKYEKTGVCRNFADDMVRKLNIINPSYNARSVAVSSDYSKADLSDLAKIERTNLVSNETYVDDDKAKGKNEEKPPFNHAIVAVDINFNNKIITLFLDPTNPSIGVYRNGDINIFNSDKFEINTDFNYIKYVVEGASSYLKNGISDLCSHFNNITDEEFEKLNETFGKEAQNKAIENIKQNSKNDFKDNLSKLNEDFVTINEDIKIEFKENTKEDFEKYNIK